ncbi:tyrosine-type recombinase/integrase [Baekduia alba]|uniref:tyrosine-type recombinase/integrase n=1 Tax=Baekduia alba TaxID=2997333 RepID=UPI002340E21A|nr:site-specific integrase [Baekduia alba]
MVDGRPRFRVVGVDLEEARRQRGELIEAARRGEVPVAPNLRLDSVVEQWLSRYETLVAGGLRRSRTLEAHRYYLDRHLLPRLGRRRISAITVSDVCAVIDGMRAGGCSEKTIGNALATLHSVLRYARRQGWVVDDPIAKLEADERPRPEPRRQRVLGQQEVVRLLACTSDAYRPLVATALFTGMRISELLGLIWGDVDLRAGTIHVRAQLSRAHRGVPSVRVAPKTRAAMREIPLVPQLAQLLRIHRALAPAAAAADWVFPSQTGTPLGHRNAQYRALARAAKKAGLEDGDWPPLRFHDLRHTFASHLIIDLGLDVAQVSRILGHAQITTTLSVYTHLFDDARHAQDLKARMAASAFAALLEPGADRESEGTVVAFPKRPGGRRSSARERAAARWAT